MEKYLIKEKGEEKEKTPDPVEKETEKAVKPKRTTKDFICEYLLLMWDGLGFFGFDDTKIARLRGTKVTWWTPFTSKK